MYLRLLYWMLISLLSIPVTNAVIVLPFPVNAMELHRENIGVSSFLFLESVMYSERNHCHAGMFGCYDGSCIDRSAVCDGVAVS